MPDRLAFSNAGQNGRQVVGLRRGNKNGDGPAYHFFGFVAVEPGCAPVPACDRAVQCFAENGIFGRLDNGGKPGGFFFRPLAIGPDVGLNGDESLQRSPVVSIQGVDGQRLPVAVPGLAVIVDFALKPPSGANRVPQAGADLRVSRRPLQKMSRLAPDNLVQRVPGNAREAIVDPFNEALGIRDHYGARFGGKAGPALQPDAESGRQHAGPLLPPACGP